MPPNPVSKASARAVCRRPDFPPGPLAQALRGLEQYRRCRRLLAEPGPLLAQVRINALLDGKELLIPGPGLRDGFYLLRPFTIPFPSLPFAVSSRGLIRHGRRLGLPELAGLELELLVAAPLAVDAAGLLLGEGQGFFDLSLAILDQAGALHPEHRVAAAAPTAPPDWLLAADPWDVRADYLLGPTGVVPVGQPVDHRRYPIFRQNLDPTRLRRISPLWQLSRADQP